MGKTSNWQGCGLMPEGIFDFDPEFLNKTEVTLNADEKLKC